MPAYFLRYGESWLKTDRCYLTICNCPKPRCLCWQVVPPTGDGLLSHSRSIGFLQQLPLNSTWEWKHLSEKPGDQCRQCSPSTTGSASSLLKIRACTLLNSKPVTMMLNIEYLRSTGIFPPWWILNISKITSKNIDWPESAAFPELSQFGLKLPPLVITIAMMLFQLWN